MNARMIFKKEYKAALDAQASGLEGKARVCARRVAGLLIQKYLATHDIDTIKMNSLDLIKHLQQTSDSPELALLLSHYSEVVNTDHKLASDIDLVANLPKLAQLLNINLQELE
jgi:hypothetical protein